MKITIDIETLGTQPGSVIVSLGAVDESLKHKFYIKICRSSCAAHGLKEDSEALSFWAKQPEAARKEVFAPEGAVPLPEALSKFTDWYNKVGGKEVWGCGANFDPVLMQAAYRACGMVEPWKFWEIKCYRTLRDHYSHIMVKRIGLHHNALDDSVTQANHLNKVLALGHRSWLAGKFIVAYNAVTKKLWV